MVRHSDSSMIQPSTNANKFSSDDQHIILSATCHVVSATNKSLPIPRNINEALMAKGALVKEACIKSYQLLDPMVLTSQNRYR